MQEKVLKSAYDKLYWGPDVNQLPEITTEEFKKRVEAGEQLIVIGNIVHDVSKWIPHHPGGAPLIRAFIGKDATKAFNGGVYNHSNAGRNMLNSLRIAKLEENHHSAPLEESKYVVEYRLKSQ